MSNKNASLKSGIRDNLLRETVHDFLEQEIKNGSALSFVSAYFTINAFEALQKPLNEIAELRFLFGDPDFIKSLDPTNTEKKAFNITDIGLELHKQLQQKPVAKACAEWIKEKVEIRSTRASNLLHGKMYHIANNGVEKAIMGSSNFTMRGLGLIQERSNIELNLEVDSDRDRRDLKAWFDEIWDDDKLVEDVKEKVIAKLEQIGKDHAPELIYYKTLYELFRDEIETRKTNDQRKKPTLHWQLLNFLNCETNASLCYALKNCTITGLSILHTTRKIPTPSLMTSSVTRCYRIPISPDIVVMQAV